jgi:hypothetical protein
MIAERRDRHVQDARTQLEQALIAEFVRARGYDPDELFELPPEQVTALLKEASVFASARLTEVESRAHFVHEIHGGGRSV